MEKINLALVSPNLNAYSETFIQFHKQRLPFHIHYLYRNFLPEVSESEGELVKYNFLNRGRRKLEHLFGKGEQTFHEKKLQQYFERNQIQAVLAEYGMSGAVLTRLCRKMNIPLLVHFHGYDASVRELLSSFGARYHDMFLYAAKIFAVSLPMKAQLEKMGCAAGKIILNHYGPSEKYFQATPLYDSASFISVGRFVEKKAPHLTLAAFAEVLKHFPDAQLHMVGNGPLLEQCRLLTQEMNTAHRVKFHEVLGADEIIRLFNQSCALVQHSMVASNGDSEGTPLAVLEASAAGLPVVATRHGGIPEIIQDGITGLLCAERDVKAMAEHMVSLLKNPALAREMGLAGKNRIEQHFTLEQHLNVIATAVYDAVDKKRNY